MGIKYIVNSTDSDGNEVEYNNLKKSEAIALAVDLSDKETNVFIDAGCRSDGQQRYLNRDGYGPVGKAW